MLDWQIHEWSPGALLVRESWAQTKHTQQHHVRGVQREGWRIHDQVSCSPETERTKWEENRGALKQQTPAAQEVEEGSPEEKAGLKVLWDKLKQRLAKLCWADRIRRRRKRKEKERRHFFKDPFKFARQLLDEKRSGKLFISKEDGTVHQGPIHRHTTKYTFNTPPRFSEIGEVIKRAGSASVPGLNGIPCKLYKNCLQVAKILWKLIRVAWKNQAILLEWQQAVGVFIPKEQNSATISQFRSIALLNMEGKIFFSVLVRRMTSFLKGNGYIDTSYQKAGLPGLPGCIQHSAMIWEQIQCAKRERGELHVVWLDLANAYGSVPQLSWSSLRWSSSIFHMHHQHHNQVLLQPPRVL